MLAQELGIVDVDQMMESISEQQFRRWWAFHLYVEPLESIRMDRRFGLLVSFLEMMLIGPGASYNPANFTLGWREQESEQQEDSADWKLIQAKMENLCYAFNAGD